MILSNNMAQYGDNILLSKTNSKLSKKMNIYFFNFNTSNNYKVNNFDFDQNCRFYNHCDQTVQFQALDMFGLTVNNVNVLNFFFKVQTILSKLTKEKHNRCTVLLTSDLDLDEKIKIDDEEVHFVDFFTDSIDTLKVPDFVENIYISFKETLYDFPHMGLQKIDSLNWIFLSKKGQSSIPQVDKIPNGYTILSSYNPTSMITEVLDLSKTSLEMGTVLTYTPTKTSWSIVTVLAKDTKNPDISHLTGTIDYKTWTVEDTVFFASVMNAYSSQINNFSDIPEMKNLTESKKTLNLIKHLKMDNDDKNLEDTIKYFESIMIPYLTKEMEKSSSYIRVLYNLRESLRKAYREKTLPSHAATVLYNMCFTLLQEENYYGRKAPRSHRMTSMGTHL